MDRGALWRSCVARTDSPHVRSLRERPHGGGCDERVRSPLAMVVVMLVVVIAVMVVYVDAIHVDDVAPVMPAPRENGKARDRCGAGDDPGTEEVGHAGLNAIGVPPRKDGIAYGRVRVPVSSPGSAGVPPSGGA
jgi:hypothetical protein